MAKLLKLRRGTTTQHASFTGAEGELTVDITKDTAVVHDGSQAGGTPLAKEDMSNVSSSSIAGQLGANSIDVSKVSGLALDKIYEGDSKVEVVDSGTGYVSTEVDGTEIQRHAGGASTINYLRVGANWNMADPSASGSAGIAIGDAGNSHDFIAGSQTNGLAIQSNYGIEIKQNGFPNQVYAGFNTAGCNFFVGGNAKLQVHSTGVTTHLPILPNVDSNTDLGSSSLRWQNIYTDAVNVAGNITCTGTVDGRDLSTDGSKLDTYEPNGSSYVRSDASDTLTGSTYTLNSATDQKIILSGSTSPYIRFQEGTTDRAYIQWDAGADEFILVNQQSSDYLRVGSGTNGLKYTADGSTGTVWTSSNDGSGSGLDSDTVDGIQASSFVRSDASDTLTGSTYTIDSSTDQKLVLKGSSNPYIMLREGTVDKAYFQWNASGHIDIVNNETAEALRIGSGTSGLKFLEGSTIYTVWHTGNDGSGSGLDADTVDGIHGTNFLRSDTGSGGDTANADITFSGGAGAVTIAANSDIRLSNGTWSGDTCKLQHHSNYLYIIGGSSGHILRDTSGHNNLIIESNGNVTAIGNVTAYSDKKLKTDISTINDALGICGKLRGVSYKWIRDGKPSIGVIAQEVEKVIPEIVLTNHDLDPNTGESIEVKSVDYGKMVGVLINAINELKAEVEELKGAK